MKKTLLLISIILLASFMWGGYYIEPTDTDYIQISMIQDDILVSTDAFVGPMIQLLPVNHHEGDMAAAEKKDIGARTPQEAMQKSRNAEKDSTNLFNEGFYVESIEKAEEAEYYAALAKNWFRTDRLMKRAEERMVLAVRYNMKERNPELYAEANDLYTKAQEQYKNYEFEMASENALAVTTLLQDMTPPSTGKTYTVKDKVPADCFWNIAGYPEIYGDPTQWPKIYEANKDKLRQPNNPDLIHPGMVFVIPPLN